MTRGPRWLIVTVALVATLGGCAPAGGDGDVVDDWGALPSAAPIVPPSGVCYASSLTNANRIDAAASDRLPCDQQHAVETYHVGQFPPNVAAVPTVGHPDYVAAFAECEAKAAQFLGAEWYNGRLYLDITVPQARQWDGGGRWFRCELIETKFMYTDVVVKRNSSLAGALSGAAPVALRCGNVIGKKPDNGWDDLEPVDCAQAHDAEYAGSFKAPGTEEPTDKQRESIYDGCWDTVARYLGGSRDKIQVGYLVWSTAEEEWDKGDHWVRCYAWGDDKKIVGTVKGIGNAAPRSG